jgi:hypothetical protein
MGGKRNADKVLVGKPDEKDHLEDLVKVVKITLKWIQVECEGVDWFNFVQGPVADSCEN